MRPEVAFMTMEPTKEIIEARRRFLQQCGKFSVATTGSGGLQGIKGNFGASDGRFTRFGRKICCTNRNAFNS